MGIKKLPEDAQPITEVMVVKVAHIMGPASAAAAALKEADEHDGPVLFYTSDQMKSILVEKLTKRKLC